MGWLSHHSTPPHSPLNRFHTHSEPHKNKRKSKKYDAGTERAAQGSQERKSGFSVYASPHNLNGYSTKAPTANGTNGKTQTTQRYYYSKGYLALPASIRQMEHRKAKTNRYSGTAVVWYTISRWQALIEKKGQNKPSGMDDMYGITQRKGFPQQHTTATATTTNGTFGTFTLEAPSDRTEA